MTQLYYTPPEDSLFEEVRKRAMELWHIVDSDNDKYGYATGKCDRIKDIKNVEDNFMYIVSMFDMGNQAMLAQIISKEARVAIRERMIDGGSPSHFIVF